MIAIVSFAIVLAYISYADACTSYSPPPPPPPPPPPGAPPVPPAPPPINKVIRQREQMMTRNNCKQVQVTAQNQQSLTSDSTQSENVQAAMSKLNANECLNAENFAYECEFTVYSEIALTTIYHPTGCGCAFTIQVVKPRPRAPDVANLLMVNAAYSTKVTRFSLVVYDIVADQVETTIPQFDNMALDAATTDLIEKQVGADPDGDFASITAGFAGTIKELSSLPEQLNKNNPANKNYVPAIAFTIQQKYSTGAMFKVPCTLEMHTAPNAYMSQCQPYRPASPFAYSKRAALDAAAVEAGDNAWFREFYLFPKQSNTCGNSGYTPKARYITSFYDDVDCKAARGFLSFDREFTSELKASNAVVGGWEWTRTFANDPRVIFGVPASFSSLQATWCLGYSQITWSTPTAFGKSQHALDVGICKAWPTSPDFVASTQSQKYKENHPSFPANGVDCTPAFTACPSDVTLLGFQNRNPRDFEKKADSTLLTGPRRLFCSTAPQTSAMMVVFDTMTFRGVNAGEALAKRNWDDSAHPEPHNIHMVYDAELDGLVHARHAPLLTHAVNEVLRKRGEKPIGQDPVAAAPHRDNFATNMASGSIDIAGKDGASAGDHPLKRFPETYSAPLTLDPVQSASDKEPTVYNGELVTGVPPKFCDLGDVGCTCRDASASSRCDHPYECNSIGYCVRPACPAGAAGCMAQSDGTCNSADLVVEDGHCTYKTKCTLGALGCACDANGACEGEGKCLDSVCLRPKSETVVCPGGEAGCECASDGSCTGGASCDASGLCLFKACKAGTPGCECTASAVGKKCDDGFTCSAKGKCLVSGCAPGSPGCKCLDGKKCGVKGYTCVELTRDGSQTACVGQELCPGEQTQRCLDECGPGNIAVCGKCIYSRPICRDPTPQYCNKKSYLYGVGPCKVDDSSASTLAVAALAALLALVAMF